jgi:hypothetical protein
MRRLFHSARRLGSSAEGPCRSRRERKSALVLLGVALRLPVSTPFAPDQRSGRSWPIRAVLCLLLFVVVHEPAFASDAASPSGTDISVLDFEWRSPEGCPERAHVLERVRALLSERGVGRAEPLVVRAEVSALAPSGFLAVLTTEQGGTIGGRTLEADDCAALAEGVALVVALALTPASELLPAAPPSASSGLPRASAPPPLEPVHRPGPVQRAAQLPQRNARVESEPLDWFVAAAPAVDSGVTADVAFGAVAGVGVRSRSLEFIARGTWLPERRTFVAGSNKGGAFSLASGYAGACAAFTVARSFELGPCAGFELGALGARAVGTFERNEPVLLFAAPSAGGFARLRLSPSFALRVDAAAAFPFSRHRFLLENVGVVRAVSPVTARLGVGLEASIP